MPPPQYSTLRHEWHRYQIWGFEVSKYHFSGINTHIFVCRVGLQIDWSTMHKINWRMIFWLGQETGYSSVNGVLQHLVVLLLSVMINYEHMLKLNWMHSKVLSEDGRIGHGNFTMMMVGEIHGVWKIWSIRDIFNFDEKTEYRPRRTSFFLVKELNWMRNVVRVFSNNERRVATGTLTWVLLIKRKFQKIFEISHWTSTWAALLLSHYSATSLLFCILHLDILTEDFKIKHLHFNQSLCQMSYFLLSTSYLPERSTWTEFVRFVFFTTNSYLSIGTKWLCPKWHMSLSNECLIDR